MNPLDARRRLLGRNVYKRTTEGNPAIAQGSLARRYPGITMQGWTEQAQYEGNNLFDINGYINDYNSIKNEDGSITIKSYAVGLKNKISDVLPDIKVGDVLYISATNGTLVYIGGKVSNINQNSSIEITESVLQNNTFGFYGDNNGEITISDITISKKYGEPYEPYTGGQPSPSPDYPQEIVSAGKYNENAQKWEYKVNVTGKNLLPYGEGGIKIGIPYENRGRTYILNKDGSISITTQDPSSSTGSIFIFGTTIDRKHYKLPAGKYTVSTFNGNIPNISIQLEDENGVNTRIDGGGKFELKEHEYIAYAWLYGAAGTEWNGTIYPQLEYGGVSTSYEQYKLPQAVTLTSDRPLTKWDKLEKRNGQWGWVYKSAEIESYTDESVPGEYYSTTGQLSTGAQVWYETTTETFVPLTASEQEAMNALYTFRPTTVLSNDCECEMTLTYKTKKSLEVTT